MKVFLAGFQSGFKLTNDCGQPTQALWVMVEELEAVLCRVDDLPKDERRVIADRRGRIPKEFTNCWCIRRITNRLRGSISALGQMGYSGWAWPMFGSYKTRQCWLYEKRVSEYDPDERTTKRRRSFLVVCPPDWELTASVYYGIMKWTYNDSGRVWDAHGWLNPEKATTRKPPRRKVVNGSHGLPEVVAARA